MFAASHGRLTWMTIWQRLAGHLHGQAPQATHTEIQTLMTGAVMIELYCEKIYTMVQKIMGKFEFAGVRKDRKAGHKTGEVC